MGGQMVVAALALSLMGCDYHNPHDAAQIAELKRKTAQYADDANRLEAENAGLRAYIRTRGAGAQERLADAAERAADAQERAADAAEDARLNRH